MSEASLLSLSVAAFSVGPHVVQPQCACLTGDSSCKGTSHAGLGSCPKGFILTFLFKDIISKCAYILRYWRLGVQHITFSPSQNFMDSTV